MEKHNVMVQDPQVQSDEMLNFLQNYMVTAKNYVVNDLMNAAISDHKVAVTFGTGSCTPGPDDISSTLIDRADRTQMTRCLHFLWNQELEA